MGLNKSIDDVALRVCKWPRLSVLLALDRDDRVVRRSSCNASPLSPSCLLASRSEGRPDFLEPGRAVDARSWWDACSSYLAKSSAVDPAAPMQDSSLCPFLRVPHIWISPATPKEPRLMRPTHLLRPSTMRLRLGSSLVNIYTLWVGRTIVVNALIVDEWTEAKLRDCVPTNRPRMRLELC
jgi:hypothetical protein